MAPRHALALLAIAALATLPAASAHTAAYSTDGKVRASVGFLNEPVVTYKDTGLDVCFTQNQTASPRTPIGDLNAGALSATLTAPNGQTLHKDLTTQFGRPGCVTFRDPLVLTQAGVYHLDLSGAINGTTYALTGIVVGSTAGIGERASVTFPDAGVPTNLDLKASVDSLAGRLDALETKVDAAPAPTHKSPGVMPAFLLVSLALLAAARRLR
jgi:hypothetical protein